MIELLNFLIRYCPYLIDKPGFRFKGSEVGSNAFVGSWIILESADVQVMISNERSCLVWEIRSQFDPNDNNWFSIDLVARLVGHEVSTAIMNPANSELLKKNWGAIIELFSKDKAPATLAKLNSLKVERADRLWGPVVADNAEGSTNLPGKSLN